MTNLARQKHLAIMYATWGFTVEDFMHMMNVGFEVYKESHLEVLLFCGKNLGYSTEFMKTCIAKWRDPDFMMDMFIDDLNYFIDFCVKQKIVGIIKLPNYRVESGKVHMELFGRVLSHNSMYKFGFAKEAKQINRDIQAEYPSYKYNPVCGYADVETYTQLVFEQIERPGEDLTGQTMKQVFGDDWPLVVHDL